MRGEETRLSDQYIPSGHFASTTRNVTPEGATGGKSAVAFLALLLKEGNIIPQSGISPLWTAPGPFDLAWFSPSCPILWLPVTETLPLNGGYHRYILLEGRLFRNSQDKQTNP